jgi:hypothetical protein
MVEEWGRRAREVACLAVAALSSGGCVFPLPAMPERDIPPEHREALKAQGTSRREVLMRYGEPEIRLDGDRIFAYRWDRVRGGVMLLPLQGFPIKDVEAFFLEFDKAGKVIRIGTATAWQDRTIAEQAEAWSRTDPNSLSPR